jgi:hypothetical protein
VPGQRDGPDMKRTAFEPDRMNELPPVLRELDRPVQRTSVTQALQDAVVGAALVPE